MLKGWLSGATLLEHDSFIQSEVGKFTMDKNKIPLKFYYFISGTQFFWLCQ